ncbi:MIP/aquaporin family protein [Globicatella sulfidifaciens]|uniref:Aquaporin family protein n=1 Tax=Globicatella sulfidifaciens TaxID=136093 RepID=A0A7X8C3W1_9LACT|nr:MIP/aquaporin family protein [Globicatella sulfidifaciens]NLJ18498.1 aquaporin family protein [Globicatella sulfidifaciens]
MNAFLGELIGTFVLVVLGNGVVAGNILKNTKAENTGWVMITLGWGIGCTIAVYISGFLSPAHLNPAVTLAMAAIGQLPWSQVPSFILAQMLGAMLAAFTTYLHYMPHWAETEDPSTILGTFSTAPAIRDGFSNLFGEILGTAILIMAIMSMGQNNLGAGLGPIVVGLTIISIGLSLGPTTGYAINPARDLGPRIMHQLLPIPNKGDSDWGYAWVPVVGPIIGGILGAIIYNIFIGLVA